MPQREHQLHTRRRGVRRRRRLRRHRPAWRPSSRRRVARRHHKLAVDRRRISVCFGASHHDDRVILRCTKQQANFLVNVTFPAAIIANAAVALVRAKGLRCEALATPARVGVRTGHIQARCSSLCARHATGRSTNPAIRHVYMFFAFFCLLPAFGSRLPHRRDGALLQRRLHKLKPDSERGGGGGPSLAY